MNDSPSQLDSYLKLMAYACLEILASLKALLLCFFMKLQYLCYIRPYFAVAIKPLTFSQKSLISCLHTGKSTAASIKTQVGIKCETSKTFNFIYLFYLAIFLKFMSAQRVVIFA